MGILVDSDRERERERVCVQVNCYAIELDKLFPFPLLPSNDQPYATA